MQIMLMSYNGVLNAVIVGASLKYVNILESTAAKVSKMFGIGPVNYLLSKDKCTRGVC